MIDKHHNLWERFSRAPSRIGGVATHGSGLRLQLAMVGLSTKDVHKPMLKSWLPTLGTSKPALYMALLPVTTSEEPQSTNIIPRCFSLLLASDNLHDFRRIHRWGTERHEWFSDSLRRHFTSDPFDITIRDVYIPPRLPDLHMRPMLPILEPNGGCSWAIRVYGSAQSSFNWKREHRFHGGKYQPTEPWEDLEV